MSPAEEAASGLDPRVGRSRAAILDATLDELAEVGYGPLTIEGIARRANVGKATIYRHWDGKLDLVADAITELKNMPEPPETDDHRERILKFVEAVADHVTHSRLAACIPALIEASLRDEAVREFNRRTSAERLSLGAAVLDQAKAAGHLADGTDTRVLAERLVAPIFFRRLTAADPLTAEEITTLVDDVLAPYWR